MLECRDLMAARNFFIDEEGHLRSGWRLAAFVLAFLICLQLSQLILFGAASLLVQQPLSGSVWTFALGHGSILISAMLVGWACGAIFEELPFRAMGCSFQAGWLRNLTVGTAIGAATLVLSALIAAATRSVHFQAGTAGMPAIGKTLAISAGIFIFAGAAEEALFRGYPLQTLTRANLAWLGAVLTALGFAAVHLTNPNVVPGLTLLNTALAGVLLAAGYLRTRSLWFPIGWHWAWNWMQGAIVGFPVSGIERVTPAPLLRAVNTGPEWLTGGAYGIEGGAACTVALLISTIFIWRTKLIYPVEVTNGRARGDGPQRDAGNEFRPGEMG